MTDGVQKIVGSVTYVDFPEVALHGVPARIDTGARFSSIWASAEEQNGVLHVTFLGPSNEQHSGKICHFSDYEQIVVASSMGHVQARYKVKLLVKIKGKKVRAQFTLANRSTQVYPVLIGRNILRGKFIVDVKQGHSLQAQEKQRIDDLQAGLDDTEKEGE